METKKANAEYPLHIEGTQFILPITGTLEKQLKIVDKFGGKANVCSVLVGDGNANIYLTIGKVGGGEDIIKNASLATLRQERPLKLEFGAGDYDVTLRSSVPLTEPKTIDLSLYVQYLNGSAK